MRQPIEVPCVEPFDLLGEVLLDELTKAGARHVVAPACASNTLDDVPSLVHNFGDVAVHPA